MDSEDLSEWVDAQADLSLRWAHTHFVDFVMSWLIDLLNSTGVTANVDPRAFRTNTVYSPDVYFKCSLVRL